ncbi:lysophospholipid acyltransferase family protein [Marinoscillum sp. MHG1-6]|uniref:lysophospholipid acyltransferase family protein n=1 Tax=Marinoscillum sp. MHG1-6 TaxID=2959627 RepID=UPI0021584861|nr:lysophospholipid acyltransferase family protein [Marinoscillum sp. MHG1-6]
MISSSLVVLVMTFSQKIPVVMARTMFAPGILWGCGIRLQVTGAENLPKGESFVFVSNHLSYLDIPSLFRAIPHNLHFVAKKEIKWVPFIGWYMLATGMIFVDRSNRLKAIASLAQAGKLIKKGKDVLMFPEGTRSKTGEIGEFKKGPFMLAAKAGVKVVPVSITGTEKVLPSGSFALSPGVVKVNIGQPLETLQSDVKSGAIVDKVKEEVGRLKAQITTS